MALAFIRESVATSIIDNLVNTAYSFLQENLLPSRDMEEQLERLQDTLPQIKMVLSAVENDEFKNDNKALDSWLWRFRDAVDFAEDVLDEMAYYELEEKIRARDHKVGSSISSLKRKFDKYVSHKFKEETLARLAMAVKGLDRVVVSVRIFLDLEKESSKFRGKNSEQNDQNSFETGSMLTETVVFGRENERNTIVEWLVTDSSGVSDVKLSAFTIYGIGGLGKTTLAQMIYTNERVRQFFDPIIWVCVSDQFNAVTIIKKIVEVITKDSPKICSLTSLQDDLKERVVSKKFLLVLDDVWNDEDKSQWEKLVAPLKFGHVKSKILVTTRMKSVSDMVAKVTDGKNDHLKLEGLEDNEFVKLLNKHAFYGADPDEFKNLHPIGKQITKKLGGCPLAAKVMGGVLNYCIELEYWNKVLNENVPDFHVGKDGIMLVLRLSYRHLPTYLQLCFRYCSMFPKDYQFSKDELIRMWMCSGLIEPCLRTKQRPEDVGGQYFDQLVRKSFFDLKLDEFAGKFLKPRYIMHDLLHDLAQVVSEGECMQVEQTSLYIPKTIRHLNFKIENLLAIREISHLKNLHTLCITFDGDNPSDEDMEEFSEILRGLKSLRLLSLTLKSSFKVPDTIGELIHLRYLSFVSKTGLNKQSWFPKSVYNLYNLEVIKFWAPSVKDMEEHEKNGIVNLIKLRYLDIEFKILTRIPCIGNLTFLQELELFSIGEKTGYLISELRDLTSLRHLEIINLDKVKNPTDAKEAKLNEKKKLKYLSLQWAFNCNGSPEEHEQLLENLRPYIHLEKLRIVNYGGVKAPLWMTHLFLVSLTSLDLSNCLMLANLPALGKLPSLKKLDLSYLCQVKQLDRAFYGIDNECSFPVLKELMLRDLQEFEEWAEVEGSTLFPRLEILHVYDCPKLRRFPSLPPSLIQILISSVGLEVLPVMYQNAGNGVTLAKPALSYLSIDCCPNLTSFDGCLLQQKEHMQSLSKLHIGNCGEFKHLPTKGFIDFTSLKIISIRNCPKLEVTRDTMENLLPSSLETLDIGVSGLDVRLLGSIQNLTALTKVGLYDCPNISSLPSFEILETLVSLYTLWISCPKLASLSGLEVLTSLRQLRITRCDQLLTMSLLQPPLSANVDECSLRLDQLQIDYAPLLLLEPLRNLRKTKELVIDKASSLTCLPEEWLLQNSSTLQSLSISRATNLGLLPSCMQKLQFLERLQISDAPLIRSLPDLPLSLNYLVLIRCHPELKDLYKKDTGPEWYRIAFIPHVQL